ncbi:hypothetical protein ACQVBX_09915 [Dyella sp. KULCS107]|uniref:hypothetical protein n=1 Tax=Dyella sp. KULCS107 TaxID=3422216 RepID=UPI003D6F1CF8
MTSQRSHPPMATDTPALLFPSEIRGSADAPLAGAATAPPSPQHRDYDGRGLSIGPLDHLNPAADVSERFAIR